MTGMMADGILGLSNDKGKNNIFDIGHAKGYLKSSMFAFEI